MSAIFGRRSLSVFMMTVSLTLPPTCSMAGLMGYWGFENTAVDRSGNGLDGQLVGDAVYDPDVPLGIGSTRSVLLDGDGDWVALGSPPQLDFASNSWTVAVWDEALPARAVRGLAVEGLSPLDVPEPSTIALMVLALLVICYGAMRRE